jgi:hypothetical protein
MITATEKNYNGGRNEMSSLKEDIYTEQKNVAEQPDLENGAYPTLDNYDKSKFNIDGTTLVQYTGKDSAVQIPAGIEVIGENAFLGCSDLRSVTIPSSVTKIGEDAFYRTAYYRDANNWEEGVLYIGNYLIEAKESISGHYTIQKGTKVIADYAFSPCVGLTGVTIPNSVTDIGRGAFWGCRSLRSVTLSNSVTSIEDYVFYRCNMLEYVMIPNSVTSIGGSAFDGCRRLANVTIPSSVTSIGSFAFASCTNLTSVLIPNGVTNIGRCAFIGCRFLMDIEVEDENAAYSSINGVLYNKEQTALIYYPLGREEHNYIIANSVTSIACRAFSGCNFLEQVTIPNGVTSIGDNAFNGSGLTSVEIPNSVMSIEESAFEECTHLQSVTIGKGLMCIGRKAFYRCNGLTSATFKDVSGWSYNNYFFMAQNSTPLSSVELADASVAAEYLRETYSYRGWTRQ